MYITITNLFDAGSDEHDVHATYSQLVDDQEPVNDKPAYKQTVIGFNKLQTMVLKLQIRN